MTGIIELLARFAPLLATITAVIVVIMLVNWFLRRRWRDKPDTQFRFQLIMLALSFAGLLAIIVALPVNDALRGQLLSLIGILLTAAIALSSTTFIGNIMAGIMLKAVKNARPGDFITIADLTGRVTEMGLLHTEVQTEFRDLVTVPNIYMVNQPLKVVRASGTIITAEVSLGYDVPHGRAAEVLRKAAANAELKDGFVQVRELGDFSVTYRVAGLLEDVTSLISARSRLRAAMLDALHAADIERPFDCRATRVRQGRGSGLGRTYPGRDRARVRRARGTGGETGRCGTGRADGARREAGPPRRGTQGRGGSEQGAGGG
ncbi:MAG: mechanosensitive ion channel family protein [Woeseiaceae bacterium]